MDEQQWVQKAERVIRALLDRTHVAPWIEIEARTADRPYEGFEHPIAPHHLSTARRNLMNAGQVMEEIHKTRGGRDAPLLRYTDPHCNQKTLRAAVSRKALLYARYVGWSSGAPTKPSITGPHAEHIVHDSLVKAARYGYALLNPGGGELRTLFGSPIPGGPLDTGAHLQVYDDDGRPQAHAVVLIEIKNIREWIYPSTKELYDLLYKAAAIQRDDLDTNYIPLLICRSIQIPNTRKMAQELGFIVFDLERQFIAPNASLSEQARDLRYLNEVREELGLIDLMTHAGPYDELVNRFRNVLPSILRRGRYPTNWRRFAPSLVHEFLDLRQAATPAQRRRCLNSLRYALRDLGGSARW